MTDIQQESDMRNFTLLMVGTSKGGSGKTTVSEALEAACIVAGRKVLVVDVDDGNRGYKRRSGQTTAMHLSWQEPPSDAVRWAKQHLSAVDVGIFDLGANLTATDAPVTEFLGSLVTHLKREGAKIIFLAVASPNAPGTGRLIDAMREDFGALGDVRVVENNVDGSHAFSKSLKTAGLPKIAFPQIDPGVVTVRLQRDLPLIEVLRTPEIGYSIATAIYASCIRRFAFQQSLRDIFGGGDLSELNSLAARAPTGERFTIGHVALAGDEAITDNLRYWNALSALKKADRADRDAIYRTAIEYRDAANAYSRH